MHGTDQRGENGASAKLFILNGVNKREDIDGRLTGLVFLIFCKKYENQKSPEIENSDRTQLDSDRLDIGAN
jgi:hypothetical protein